jgi:hypothetical protein
MTKFNGYRTAKVGGGGLYNGYATPKAKQVWSVGLIVNVGFVKGLAILAKEDGVYRLKQVTTGKSYTFEPHMGLCAA